MPRQAKPARLWLQPARRDRDGNVVERPVWVIRDRGRKHSTGCGPDARGEAEKRLSEYLVARHAPRQGRRHPDQILIADVLSLYADDVAPKHADPSETGRRIGELLEFFGRRRLSEVNGSLCRQYALARSTPAAARRELEDLRAAINHHRREGLCSEIVSVVLPDKSLPRERWLTHSEAARLIWAAWRYREIQKGKPTEKRSRRHVARFILVALYTGTRSGAVCTAALHRTVGAGWVDIERGVFYRRPAGQRETKKQQTPVRLPNRLLAHLRRWERLGQRYVVEWRGLPVSSIKKAFARVVADAGLGPDVTPHVLRHTAATWMMQRGVKTWDAAGFLGMTQETLERVYGHHHPDYQRQAADSFDNRPRQLPDRNPRENGGQTATNGGGKR